MLLSLSTWQDVDTYLARSKGIIIPIGSHEQHGPTGFLGTDALCPELIAKRASDNSVHLVGPTFNVGVAQHHLGFSGTITLKPSTFIAAMQDWIDSLLRHGFERIYFLNGHGGNIASIQAGFSESYSTYSLRGEPAPHRLKLRNWWELPGVMSLCQRLHPVADGGHATASEIALTYAGYPDHIKSAKMSPKVAPDGPIHDAAHFRVHYPDGRMGSDPTQATVKNGERILDLAAEKLIDEAKAFFEET